MTTFFNRFQLPGFILGSYLFWLALIQSVGLALTTYGMIGSKASIQEIADQYSANFWTIQGLGALSYFLLCLGLSWSRPAPWISFPLQLAKKSLFPSMIRASLSAFTLILLLMMITPFEFIGLGLSWGVAPWGIFNWLTRSLAWLGWALGDELVFRNFLLQHIRKELQLSARSQWVQKLSDFISILLTTGLWILLRSWHQFLGWSQTLTLTLIGMILGIQVCRGRHYLVGATWLVSAAWVFQSFFSLPVLGYDHTGLFLIRFSSGTPETNAWLRLIHGGAGGPGASLLLQLILFCVLFKILWTQRQGSIR